MKRVRRQTMKKKIDLTTGSILKKLLIVAIPTLLTSIVQMTYNLTDMFWVARVDQIGFEPVEAVAAIGTAGFLPWFGFGLIILVRVGTSVYVSQSAGRNDRESVYRYANNGLLIMVILALLFTIYGRYFNHHFVGLFRIENENVIAFSQNYLRIVSTFAIFLFASNLFNGVYDGLGKTINTFYIMASGLVINMILDPIFILGLGYGVEGAAYATVIAQGVVFLTYVVIYMTPKRPALIHPLKYINMKTIKEIFTLGLPVGLQSMTMTAISIAVGIMVASFGPVAMTVSRIGSQIEALSWMVASGFQVALSAFVGQNLGAGQIERIKAGYKTSMKLLVPYGLAINFILFIFAEPLFALFINDPVTTPAGATYLRIISLSQLFMILELTTAGAFNGLGKTMVPSAIGVVGNALRIPFAYAAISMAGIWWAVSLSSIFKGTLMVIVFVFYFYYLRPKRTQTLVLEKS